MLALMWTAAGLLLLLLGIYLIFCGALVNKFLGRRPYDPDRFVNSLRGTDMAFCIEPILREREWLAKQDREQVFIQSYDGLSLHGQYLTQKNSRGTLLLCHGFQSSGEGDFSCILKDYYELGFDLLIIDQRAHLQSQGKYLTMGVKERYDVRAWCLWLLQRRGEKHKVVLDGISMGAASVLMASGLDLPLNVVGVLADCGFTTPREIFTHVMQTGVRLPTWILWGADLCCRVMAGFSIDGASTVDAVRRSDLPLLMLHGEGDDFVPCWMSRKTFAAAAAPDKQLLTVPGAGHGLSFLVDRERVWAALVTFLDRICPKAEDKR